MSVKRFPALVGKMVLGFLNLFSQPPRTDSRSTGSMGDVSLMEETSTMNRQEPHNGYGYRITHQGRYN